MDKTNQKQWWAPVWTGLVMDAQGAHHKKIKSAVWLYLYLLLNADRKSGFLKRKIKTVCLDTGINSRTIKRWLRLLKRNGYIEMRSTGRCVHVQITKWKNTEEVQNLASQRGQKWPIRGDKCVLSEEAPSSENLLDSCGETSFAPAPIDISIKKDIIKTDIDSKTSAESDFGIPAGWTPKTREECLALDLAEGLNDHKGFLLCLSYSKKYPESLLRKVLQEVKALPDKKIKKSRGALFNHLVRKYVQ